MFYFYTNSLGFDPEFMGRIRLLGRCAVAVGACCIHSAPWIAASLLLS